MTGFDRKYRLTDMEESTMDPVVHFEMPYDDRERMAKFYGAAFGWQTQMLGEQMGNYVLATTTESDEAGPKTPGVINGGFFPKKPDWPAQHPSVVIAVVDIRESMRKVTGAGGKVHGEPIDIPGIGQYVAFNDTEGNRISMLQPVPRDFACAAVGVRTLDREPTHRRVYSHERDHSFRGR